jgi:26S proteasome regulatory subunit (ATPase 3-interacting protein)
VTLSEIKASIAEMEREKSSIQARLQVLQSGDAKPVAPAQRDRVQKNYRKWQKCALARKKICVELWGQIMENLEKDKGGELKEELGLNF